VFSAQVGDRTDIHVGLFFSPVPGRPRTPSARRFLDAFAASQSRIEGPFTVSESWSAESRMRQLPAPMGCWSLNDHGGASRLAWQRDDASCYLFQSWSDGRRQLRVATGSAGDQVEQWVDSLVGDPALGSRPIDYWLAGVSWA